ncbi:MAG TPA: glycosyltransferase [Steroidobacteraceae bacterium]|nr:glycosyltransferase [Steroidobacteraceae bacterium]
MTWVLSLAWLGAVAWLIAHALGQRHALARVRPLAARADAPPVAILVPARDERDNIAPCLSALRALDYPRERLRIVVIDDDSSDDTAAIVARLAAEDARITLVRAPPLPPGWKGKVHACVCGVAAVPAEVPWLCFLDADMRADPPLLASALEAARAGALDLLSLAPRQLLGSLAERLILPCGLYLLGFSQDLARVQAPDSGDAVATGQFLLVRREAYERSGGFASVRAEICEDVAFARRLKRAGFRVLLEDGSAVLAVRMYTGWATLWPGIAKNLIEMIGGARRTLLTAAVAVLLAWAAILVPLYDLSARAPGAALASVPLAAALAGSAAAFGLHLAGAVHFRIPWYYGLLFPLGYTVGAVIALDSVRWRVQRRVRWKGRLYT